MVNFWTQVFGKAPPPSREQVDAVQSREVAEATRQRLERAIKHRQHEIRDLVDEVMPKRGAEQ